MGKNTVVFGIYPDHMRVERSVEALREAGFRNTDISVLLPENVGSKDLGVKKGSKAPEGAATGAASGAVVGGALRWLSVIGALVIVGLYLFIASWPILAAVAGVGAGGTVGGVAGALVGWGIPEYEAKRYEGRIKKGGILLSVHCDDSEWKKRAKQVLEQTGAEDVSSTGESKADYAKSDASMPRGATSDRKY
jgi:hypothetical protein